MRRSKSSTEEIDVDAGVPGDTIRERNDQSTEILRLSADTVIMPFGVPAVDALGVINLQLEHETLDHGTLAKTSQRPIIKSVRGARAAVPVNMRRVGFDRTFDERLSRERDTGPT